jgi:RND family efflux transporter MFP subunit
MNLARASLGAALGAALLAACGHRTEQASLPEAGAAPHAVRVARPAVRIETGLSRATGTLRARDEAVLSAKATGQIRRIRVGVGDRVRTGAPLVEMDAVNAQIAHQNAKAAERLATANLAQADQEVARSRQLFEQGALPQAGWEKVQTARELAAAQLDQARAAVRAAEQALSDTTLVAPFDGVVSAKFRNAGDTVTLMPVTPIVQLTDLDHLEARLTVPEAIEPFVKVGGTIEGVLTPSGQRFAAKVRVKNAVVDPASRTVEVLADVVKVNGAPLKPGSMVEVDFGAGVEGSGLYIPATAIRTDEKGSTTVLVLAGGKAVRRDVEVAPVHPGTVAVKRGIEEKDEVVLDPGGLNGGEAVVPLAD